MNRNLLILTALAAMTSQASAQGTWKYQDGRVSIEFDRRALSRTGIKVGDLTESLTLPGLMTNNTWSINTNRTTFGWSFGANNSAQAGGGELEVRGGFSLALGSQKVSFRDFTIYANRGAGLADLRVMGFNYPPYIAVQLDASSPTVRHDIRTGQLEASNYELTISQEMASAWNRPELAGTVLGKLTVSGDLVPAPRDTVGEAGTQRSALDLGLCQLSGLSIITSGGTPRRESIGGEWYTALTAATLSNNYGTGAITWVAYNGSPSTMRTMHPTIGLNTFRKLSTGELEQIGEGQLKHGWFAVNGATCNSCGSGIGNGMALGQGCADPYSTSNNANRADIGPKSEVNPYTGIWNDTNSWFDTRGSNPTYSQTQMYMKVAHSDIVPGATYFYEGYYMTGFVNNGNYSTTNLSQVTQMVDVDKYNNFAWNNCNFSVTTSTSTSTSTLTVTSSGNFGGVAITQHPHPNRMPLIMTWGDSRQVMKPDIVGDVVSAVRVTPVSGDPGWFKYDYSVYNMDLDRQMKSFHVSVADSVNVRNITFRDIDKDASNEWIMTRANGDISWEMQAGTPNPLIYGRLYNFRFEAQAAAVPSWNSATMVKSGTFPELNTAASGPPPSTQPVTGTITIPGWVGPVQPQVDLRLTPVDSGSLTNVNDVPVSHPSGAMSAQVGIRGRYMVSVAGAPFLRKNFAPIVTVGHDGNDVPVNVTLISGDIDGSGEIDAADIDAAIAEFGSTASTPADCDGTGEVDAADIDLVISNFGATGDV